MSSLGERLQALRREFRANLADGSADHAGEIMALRRELAALKHRLADRPAVPAVKKRAAAKPAVAVKKAPIPRCAGRMPPSESGIGAMITSGVRSDWNHPTTRM